jgi:hypothetical protein
MTIHNENFCRGIAEVLRGESLKARAYVTHNPSLGVLRERMVAEFIRDATPDRCRVETGLVCNEAGRTSRQCDIVIHESSIEAPFYRWKDFVVAPASTTNAVVEVKSKIGKSELSTLFGVVKSVVDLSSANIAVFGYGLSGVTFKTCVNHIASSLKKSEGNGESVLFYHLPQCIAVQDQNYVGVLPSSYGEGVPCAFCMLDLKRSEDKDAPYPDGMETGIFLQIYGHVLKKNSGVLSAKNLYSWFNKLPIADAGKVWITEDGKINKGNIPVEGSGA